jgi:parallel beta-helix repeat protein
MPDFVETVSHTTGMGIYSNGGSTKITNCNASTNKGDGIYVVDASLVRDNVATYNNTGVHATGTNDRIESNLVSDNGTGILVDTTVNLVIRNTARDNTSNYNIPAGNRIGTIVTPATSSASGSTGGAAVSTDAWVNIAY